MKRQPISTGSEWTFDLIRQYDREIGRIAERYALDTYPNQIEVITAEQMMDAYASVGMPLGYHHWSYGKQFLHTESLPFDAGPEMNLLSLHPALIALAKDLLGVPDVHLYQSHSWAKFTGEADYDQVHHCDFGNHTLTVPSDEAALRSVDFIIYIDDVTDDLGALHYVEKADSRRILGKGAITAPLESQAALKACERSAAAPSGSLLAHSIDTFHRGTNLTAEGGHRYTMTAGYKAAGNDMVSYHVWQQAANRPWDQIMNHASPLQLASLGIPLPGDRFWTDRTLKLTQRRWPDWDMREYFSAHHEAAKSSQHAS